MSHEWLALLAAFLWAASSLVSVTPSRHLGAFAYNRWRMALSFVTLSIIVTVSGGWYSLQWDGLHWIVLSGLVGIFIGDSALFACMNRLGPRRTGVLFSCHAVFSVILGIFIFSEQLDAYDLLGILLIFFGVILAIFFGKRSNDQHAFEAIQGHLGVGIALGILAALCQACGAILIKPVMQTDVDPMAVTTVRIAIALLAHLGLLWSGYRLARCLMPVNRHILLLTWINGFVGISLGMSVLLMALRHGDVGIVSVLSATTPVMLLPMLWWFTKVPPNAFAWLGAILSVIGSVVLL